MGRRIGVDEAGRGPVLGSLFVAGVAIPSASVLPEGVGDSKAITPATRERLAGALDEQPEIETATIELGVEAIDTSSVSLTALVADAFAEAIDALAEPGDTVVVDAGEENTERFATRVERHLDTDVAVNARVRGDATVPVIGAASIVAKEAREQHVGSLAEDYGPIGSGYPSDPATRSFLAEYLAANGELPACARSSWSTCDDLLAAAEQADLDAFRSTD